MSKTSTFKFYSSLDREKCIPTKHLSDDLDAAPPIAPNRVFLPPLLVWGVLVDWPWIRQFAKENDCEPQVGPDTDPDAFLMAHCNAKLKRTGSLLAGVWALEGGKVVFRRALCVYTNHMPKEDRKMPDNFKWPDERAEPMWYYETARAFWAKRVYED